MINKSHISELFSTLAFPIVGLALFLALWNIGAKQVNTSLGQFPGPAEVYTQFSNLISEHNAERTKAAAFYERQDKRNENYIAKGKPEKVKHRIYTGKDTFFDQIVTSLVTVFSGFLIGTLTAIPMGILAGLSNAV